MTFFSGRANLRSNRKINSFSALISLKRMPEIHMMYTQQHFGYNELQKLMKTGMLIILNSGKHTLLLKSNNLKDIQLLLISINRKRYLNYFQIHFADGMPRHRHMPI